MVRTKRPTRATAGKRPSVRKHDISALTVTLPQFLIEGSDLQFREFLADLFAAAAGMQSLRRALAKSVGLSAAEFSVLLATWYLQRKGRVGITAIAKHLHVATAHVTAEVGRLVRAEFIKKTQHREDTRAVTVVLTRRGEKILNELAPLLQRINDRLFSGNTPNAIATVAKFLKHVADESTNSVRMARGFSG
jgi:MarR family transcriptional regulator, organic hydroperoxide resistance regulator